MKTKSLNTLLKHKFFLYGMIALSVLQLVNFYRTRSLTCLGTFGVAYYLGCMMTKNKALCLLFAILVSTFVMGCEGRFVTLYEGIGHMGGGGGGSDPCAEVSDLDDDAACISTLSSDNQACVYTAAVGDDPNATDYQAASCAAPAAQCSSYLTEQDCVSPCNWENGSCNDQ